MKKLLLLTGAIIALGGITSCSDDNVASLDPVTTQAEENTPVSFGTYVGNAKSTRAGATGQLKTSTLPSTGFGVFAYNTSIYKFGEEASEEAAQTDGKWAVNYMYNQQVTGSGKEYPYTWTTNPVKFWPNPTVDYNDNLTTKPQYVTFLAYAPYINFDNHTAVVDQTYGIKNFVQYGKSSGDVGAAIATTNYSDMCLEYSTKAGSDGNQVDLLWGTAGTNGVPAAIKDDGYVAPDPAPNNQGEPFSNTADENVSRTNTYSVNANLIKMRTDGKVQFVFKHALGGFGGSPYGPQEGSGNGILIDYYADKDWNESNEDRGNGAAITDVATNSKTRVYVNWIAIEFMTNDKNSDGTYSKIADDGYFDLVTGQWYRMLTEQGSKVSIAADKRPKTIWYFSNDGTGPKAGDGGYQKFLETYATSQIPYTITNKNLNTALIPLKVGTLHDIDTYDNLVMGSGWDNRTSAGVQNLARTIYQDTEAPILFIPGTKLTVKVVVNYDIVTPDPNLATYVEGSSTDLEGGYTIANHVMAKQVNFGTPILMNRVHALYIHLGLTSIKLDAVVDQFSTDVADTTNPDGSAVTAEIQDAPISPNEDPNSSNSHPKQDR